MTRDARTCPQCGAAGRPVKRRTPAHLLLEPERLGPGPFLFCATPECGVVYFSADRGETYRKADVSVRVGLKETADPIPLCYCFGFTRAMLREELERDGTTTIPDRIREGIAERRCACDVKNPQGTCCLGGVQAAERAMRAAAGTQGSAS